MNDVTDAAATFDVDCPHCKKTFSAELMAGSAERYNGFKCPHCRLFVPLKRRDPSEQRLDQGLSRRFR